MVSPWRVIASGDADSGYAGKCARNSFTPTLVSRVRPLCALVYTQWRKSPQRWRGSARTGAGKPRPLRPLPPAWRSEQIEFWRESIASGERFEPNPSFSGSTLVGDADGDWFVGETLIDCKVYRSLTIPKLRDFLRQLLGYVMLDLDDALGIRRVGVWLPRQRLTPTWSLTRLLGGDPEELLPSLREGFVRAARGQQLSVPTPISERHKHQVLADNRHTPYEMLSDLARSDDKDIRHRVGRNAVTPEVTVRTLAGDPYARVREGVAMNERAPGDVLEALAQDSSIKVRRAVAANPGAPQSLPKALTSDLDRDLQQAACVNDHVML